MEYTPYEQRILKGTGGSQRARLRRQKLQSHFYKGSYARRQLALSPAQEELWANNPHLQQSFIYKRPVEEQRQPFRFRDLLCNHLPTTHKYRARYGEWKSTVHDGQLKLLISEILFLTEHSQPGDTVLYAGAAPGVHIDCLRSFLFPWLQYVLVDPRGFKVKTSENTVIRQEFFTDKMAQEYQDTAGLLFISDVRTQEQIDTQSVQADMNAQMQWHRLMKPRAGLYKMRLPYHSGRGDTHLTYMKGQLLLQPFAGQTSSETRLVVVGDGTAEQQYSQRNYDSRLYYHNTRNRCSLWDIPCARQMDRDRCWDCAGYRFALSHYLERYWKGSPQEYEKILTHLMTRIQSVLNRRAPRDEQ